MSINIDISRQRLTDHKPIGTLYEQSIDFRTDNGVGISW